MSKEDRYALQMMEKSKTIVDGHYQVALPWRPRASHLEDNYERAKVQLSHLKGRLLKNSMLKKRYVDVAFSYISQGHAEQVFEEQAATSGWYLPHHPVQHPHKPDKVRVVFDCGVKYPGSSLNAQLLKGPDFMSSLVGVLKRFRLEKFAIVGDVEQMFHLASLIPGTGNIFSFCGDLEEI